MSVWVINENSKIAWEVFYEESGVPFRFDSEGGIYLDLSKSYGLLPFAGDDGGHEDYSNIVLKVVRFFPQITKYFDASLYNTEWSRLLKTILEDDVAADYSAKNLAIIIEKLNELLEGFNWSCKWAGDQLDQLVERGLASKSRKGVYAVSAKMELGLPRPGWVYLLEGEQTYKIGRTKNLSSRLAQISPKLPFEIRLLGALKTADCVELEQELHKRFSGCRTNGEWFGLTLEDIEWFKAQDNWVAYP